MKDAIINTKSDKVFLLLVNAFLVLSGLIILYPLIYVLSASLSSSSAIVEQRVWLWPVEITLDGYSAVFKNQQIMAGYVNSAFYTIVGTAINIFFTILAAYPLSRREFKARNVISWMFIFTMLFSGGLIPSYLLVKNLGMLDTRLAILIPSAMSVWNVVITRTFFQHNIPDELYESSRIDNCNDLNFLIRIVVPLSAPIIAVNVLYYGIGRWNSFFDAYIYLKSKELYPLQVILRSILILSDMDMKMVSDPSVLKKAGMAQLIKYAVIIVASVPTLIIYPFVQKYFVKGIMIGALKG